MPNVREREAWLKVLAIADATAPFSFTEFEPLLAIAQETVDADREGLDNFSSWAKAQLVEMRKLIPVVGTVAAGARAGRTGWRAGWVAEATHRMRSARFTCTSIRSPQI